MNLQGFGPITYPAPVAKPQKAPDHHINPTQFASALGNLGEGAGAGAATVEGAGAAAAEGAGVAGAAGGLAELAPLLLL